MGYRSMRQPPVVHAVSGDPLTSAPDCGQRERASADGLRPFPLAPRMPRGSTPPLQEFEKAPREMALEAAADLPVRLALLGAPGRITARLLMVSEVAEHDGM